jgi:hypothetical protein
MQNVSAGGRRGLAAATLVIVVGAAPAIAGGAACPGDFDASGDVGFTDLSGLLAAWGVCEGCPEDFDRSGDVGFADLSGLLAAWGPCPAAVATAIDLAGNPLDRYPWFEFVQAFEENAPFAVAIDPRHLDGQAPTCDVYVVAARSEMQWGADRTLADTRGGPQTVTFGGASIQANTIDLVDAAALSGDAGPGYGVGYDLVCDCNRNGVLDDGDFIDGLTSPAGLYVVRDPTTAGPYSVSSTTYSVPVGSVTAGYEPEKVYYPASIATLGALPLVTISHGNGHQYTWYDYLGEHLASYGFVVMSHRNNTVPGIETASTTTYQHTDAFLDHLGDIAGGALVGHVDVHRIAWIGHSRGGEGVARAYTRVRDGLVTTQNYTAADVILVSSIAPNNSLGAGETEPGMVNYHLIWGAADGDISGSATLPTTWSFAIFERAEGFRQSTYVHGADHNDFNCCGFDDFSGGGAAAIGRAETQRVAKATYLVLLQRYLEGNAAAGESFWRQTERFSPDGVAPTTVVVNDYREATEAIGFVIDDFQSSPATGVSSSGGAVTFDVENLVEDVLGDDANGYAWNGSEPMNGMTRAWDGDDARGIVFDWGTAAARFIEFEIVPGARNFTSHTDLSFRACQGTRHPDTTAELADVVIGVALRDGAGNSSTIRIDAFGGGIEEPYQRSGGWQNEFEVVRIRLEDFLNDASGLDLTDVVALRFEFSSTFGSGRGRLGLYDVALSNDSDPPPPGAITISLPDGVPEIVAPGVPTVFDVVIAGSTESVVPGTATLHYRDDGGVFQTAPLTFLGGDLYEATLPVAACDDTPEFYLSAEGASFGTVRLPRYAPDAVFAPSVGVRVILFGDDFETDTGWSAENLGASSGAWQRGIPVDDPGWEYDPAADFDGSGQCWLTQNEPGNTDVDDGAVRLTSPVFDMSVEDASIEYAYYLRMTSTASDRLLVEINADGGTGAWATIAVHDMNDPTWRTHRITTADLLAGGVTPTASMRIRFTADDADPQSVVEAGIDAFSVTSIVCE